MTDLSVMISKCFLQNQHEGPENVGFSNFRYTNKD